MKDSLLRLSPFPSPDGWEEWCMLKWQFHDPPHSPLLRGDVNSPQVQSWWTLKQSCSYEDGSYFVWRIVLYSRVTEPGPIMTSLLFIFLRWAYQVSTCRGHFEILTFLFFSFWLRLFFLNSRQVLFRHMLTFLNKLRIFDPAWNKSSS